MWENPEAQITKTILHQCYDIKQGDHYCFNYPEISWNQKILGKRYCNILELKE